METFEAIEQRRSVKHFDTEHKMSAEEVEKLFSAAILSPTSFNMQNWRFVNVVDPELRAKVCGAAWGQAQVTEAAMLVLVCADLNAYGRDPQRYWRNAPEEVSGMMVPMMEKFYDASEQLKRDEAMRSVGLAATTLMLAAKSMGYDSCPMIGFDPVKAGELINLPDDHVIGMLLTIGKAAQPARGRGGQLPLDEVLFTDRF